MRIMFFFFFSSRRRHTRLTCDWSSDVCSSDLRRDVVRAQRGRGGRAGAGAWRRPDSRDGRRRPRAEVPGRRPVRRVTAAPVLRRRDYRRQPAQQWRMRRAWISALLVGGAVLLEPATRVLNLEYGPPLAHLAEL